MSEHYEPSLGGAATLPRSNERVLCLAPPGDLMPLAASVRARVGPGGRVAAVVRGESWLSAALPPAVEVIDDDLGEPRRLQGPFDLALVWGSLPFLHGLPEVLAPLREALRPGARLWLDVPAHGFCIMLQTCDPRVSQWYMPGRAEVEDTLHELGWRDVRVESWVELVEPASLGDLFERLARPFPLDFEGERGRRLAETLRLNLARGFGDFELAIACHRVRALCRR